MAFYYRRDLIYTLKTTIYCIKIQASCVLKSDKVNVFRRPSHLWCSTLANQSEIRIPRLLSFIFPTELKQFQSNVLAKLYGKICGSSNAFFSVFSIIVIL